MDQLKTVEIENNIDASILDGERASNVEIGLDSEAIRSAVNAVHMVVEQQKRCNVKTAEKKEKKTKRPNHITDKMKLFMTCLTEGLSPKESYKKAYDTKGMDDASVLSSANKLMKDERVSLKMQSYWETKEESVITDDVATRRLVMRDLFRHSQDDKVQLSNRLKSLELMGRAIGMFTDKVETKTEVVDTEQLKKELDQLALDMKVKH
jgi:hypothetical protein